MYKAELSFVKLVDVAHGKDGRTIDTRHKLRHAFYATVNAWLGRYVVVLYTVQKSGETPE